MMLWLTLSTLRTRKGGLLGTFIALLIGSAVLSVCGILLESGLRSDAEVRGGRRGRRGAPAGGHARRRQEDSSTDAPEADPGGAGSGAGEARTVDQDAWGGTGRGDIGVFAQMVGPDGVPLAGADGTQSLGHNWSSTQLGPFRLTSGRAPVGMTDVVLDTDLAARLTSYPATGCR